MKLITKAALAAVLAFGFSQAAAAGVIVEGYGARADARWGGELGIGYRAGFAGFAIAPSVGVFLFEGDNDRYFRDQAGGAQGRCRDSRNGYFAKDSLCDNTAVRPYGRLEATYSVPLVAEFGGGVRVSSEKVRPYGTIGFPIGPVALKGNVGDGYYALGLRAGF